VSSRRRSFGLPFASVEQASELVGDGVGQGRGVGRIGGFEVGDHLVDGRIIHAGHYPRTADRKCSLLPVRDVNPTRIRPLMTWAIIAANVAVFFLTPQQSPAADEFAYRHAAIACELTTGEPVTATEVNTGTCIDGNAAQAVFPDKQIWLSVLVSMFLHAGLAHILFNMWSLWIFGNNVEEAFGSLLYLGFYLASGVAATLGFVFMNPQLTDPLVGASGAIAGVMGAYLVLYPRHQVMTLVLYRIVAIPAVWFLGIWFASQFLLLGGDSGVAWQAHVVGFGFGVAVAGILRPWLLSRTLSDQPTSVYS
jgi:membrane associated rhomboid family serine protease